MSTDCAINSIEAMLIHIVADLTQDWGIHMDESMDGQTLLVADLAFASVDIIQLCVAIEQQYNRKFGFQDLLMDNGRYITDLSILQMAEFLNKKLEDRTQ
jgi:acyl carrier protein